MFPTMKRFTSALIDKIIETETLTFNEVFECKGRIYTFLNPVSYLDALERKDLFCQFDGIWADGSLLVAAINLLYGKKVIRRSFDMTSIAPKLLDYAEKHGKTIYIVASQEEEVKKAVGILLERNPQLIFVGYRNGYFSSDGDIQKEVQYIVNLNPDFLIVGMGAVKQEQFLQMIKEASFKGVGFTCGGFIHQTAKGEMDFYPDWVNRLNIRFIYRMIKEGHTRKRYIKAAILFPAKFIFERFWG